MKTGAPAILYANVLSAGKSGRKGSGSVYPSAQEIAGKRTKLFIGGAWVDAHSGRYLDSYDPATGEPWFEAADADAEDVDRAIQAATKALRDPAWRCLTQTDRGRLIRRLADLIAGSEEALAAIETRDNGKLIREMRAQVNVLPDIYNYYAGMADKIQGEVIPNNKPDIIDFTLREPIGVVALIVPWNSPLYVIAGTLAPCLAIGNTVVIKPSEHASASALALMELIRNAGFPAGVVNVVTGHGATAGDALTRHPGIAKIAFTGGSETGKRVAGNGAQHLAPCVLELGGKSPHVVFDDADLDRAVNGMIGGIFAAAGQSCVAGSRCLVHERVYDEVLARFAEQTRKVRIGHPANDETQLGPLALKAQLEKVHRYVAYGIEDGARLVAGGRQPQGAAFARGWYYEPTVFAEVNNGMRIARDGIFGPAAGIMRFKDERALIEQANDTIYGLAAGIWTRDIDRVMPFARDVNAGTVWINTYRAASFMSPAGGSRTADTASTTASRVCASCRA
jgi:acyl-CoA reductase-like NAD-dependent aldehyde dehydrogenase